MLIDIILSLLNFQTMYLILLATVTGIIFGALPGIGPALAMALMLPFTFNVGPMNALAFLGTLFGATVYGGSISAILINTPGTPGSAATSLDGYPMTQQGKGGVALGIAATASAVGGIVSMIVLIILAPLLASITLLFGPIDYVLMALLGLSVIVVSSSKAVLKGFIMTGLGLLLAFFGMDLVYGVYRFTFGIQYLQDGIDYVPALIGLFGLSQALVMGTEQGAIAKVSDYKSGLFEGVKETFRYPKTLVRSIVMGIGLGILPGVGISTANFLAYNTAQALSKDPDSFGKGNPEGVIAPEAANNAVEGGALIPTYALGIPGSSSCAIMLAAMMMQGLEPGIRLFSTSGHLVYTASVGAIIGLIMTWFIGMLGSRWFARIAVISNQILTPMIVLLSLTGAFALRNNIGDMVLTMIFGFLGYFFKAKKYPMVPLILGMILGPLVEKNFIRAMIMSEGSLSILFDKWVTVILLICLLAAWFFPSYKTYKTNAAKKAA